MQSLYSLCYKLNMKVYTWICNTSGTAMRSKYSKLMHKALYLGCREKRRQVKCGILFLFPRKLFQRERESCHHDKNLYVEYFTCKDCFQGMLPTSSIYEKYVGIDLRRA